MAESILEHGRCNCHQCTWLRANQFERAFIPPVPQPKKECCLHGATCPQPTFAQEKCGYLHKEIDGSCCKPPAQEKCDYCEGECYSGKPNDPKERHCIKIKPSASAKAVEERINKICYSIVGEDWGRSLPSASEYRRLFVDLQELVKLAQDEARK